MTTRAQHMDHFLARLEKQVWAIWLPVVASAASTTVNATLIGPDGNAAPHAFLQFDLKYCLPRLGRLPSQPTRRTRGRSSMDSWGMLHSQNSELRLRFWRAASLLRPIFCTSGCSDKKAKTLFKNRFASL